jgi:hypothetical protein
MVFCLVIVSAVSAYADTLTVAINHFVIKENPFAKDEVAIIATDSLVISAKTQTACSALR